MSSGICKVNSFVNKLISLPIMYNASTNIVYSHGRKILVNYELSLRPALKKCVGMQELTHTNWNPASGPSKFAGKVTSCSFKIKVSTLHKQWSDRNLPIHLKVRSYHAAILLTLSHCTKLHRNYDVTPLLCRMKVKFILTWKAVMLQWLAAESNRYIGTATQLRCRMNGPLDKCENIDMIAM